MDSVPALRAVSSNWEATMAPRVYPEEKHGLPGTLGHVASWPLHVSLHAAQEWVDPHGTHPGSGAAACPLQPR